MLSPPLRKGLKEPSFANRISSLWLLDFSFYLVKCEQVSEYRAYIRCVWMHHNITSESIHLQSLVTSTNGDWESLQWYYIVLILMQREVVQFKLMRCKGIEGETKILHVYHRDTTKNHPRVMMHSTISLHVQMTSFHVTIKTRWTKHTRPSACPMDWWEERKKDILTSSESE